MKDIQAFPAYEYVPTYKQMMAMGGMTLRDYFAAKAMQSIFNWSTNLEGELMLDEVAEDAYLLADAMLKARG